MSLCVRKNRQFSRDNKISRVCVSLCLLLILFLYGSYFITRIVRLRVDVFNIPCVEDSDWKRKMREYAQRWEDLRIDFKLIHSAYCDSFLYTGSSKKMDGIWNRYNLKSTGRIYTFGVLKCSETFKVLDLP